MESKYTKIDPLTTEDANTLLDLIEEYNLQIFTDYYTLITLGYHFLSDSTKFTYLYLKGVADTNFLRTKECRCKVQPEYLSIIYNNSIKTQKNNIAALIHYELIVEDNGEFIVYDPIIEETFKQTIYKIIYRKELKRVSSYITSCRNAKDRQEYMNDLRYLIKKDEEYPFLKELTSSFNKKRVEQFT